MLLQNLPHIEDADFNREVHTTNIPPAPSGGVNWDIIREILESRIPSCPHSPRTDGTLIKNNARNSYVCIPTSPPFQLSLFSRQIIHQKGPYRVCEIVDLDMELMAGVSGV